MATILVVEDDTLFQQLLTDFLNTLHHSVITTNNGKHAFQLYTTELPDIVLCDIRMPKQDGLDFLLKARAYQKHKARGIILMSGKGNTHSEEYRNIVKNLGAYDFLQKPFPLETLANKINTLLNP
jgi:two-component system, NtrC family, nitrogen regulation response regulator NtrX